VHHTVGGSVCRAKCRCAAIADTKLSIASPNSFSFFVHYDPGILPAIRARPACGGLTVKRDARFVVLGRASAPRLVLVFLVAMSLSS
jgi:hypothetical protein